jgi:hypothetical protein
MKAYTFTIGLFILLKEPVKGIGLLTPVQDYAINSLGAAGYAKERD